MGNRLRYETATAKAQVNAESLDVSPATKEEIPTAQQYLAHLSTKQLTASASVNSFCFRMVFLGDFNIVPFNQGGFVPCVAAAGPQGDRLHGKTVINNDQNRKADHD